MKVKVEEKMLVKVIISPDKKNITIMTDGFRRQRAVKDGSITKEVVAKVRTALEANGFYVEEVWK